jgi:ketosteroid isomerase-like protein
MGMQARYPIAILGMVVVCLTTVAVQKQALAAPEDTQANVTKRLERFDQLDFDAFSKQDWKLFTEIHCPNVVVTFPDGHQTHGIKKHTEDMVAMFVPMPDLRITEHSVSFGSDVWARSTPTRRTSAQSLTPGEWTSTVGIMEGTFTKPMTMGDKTIQPTGKKLKLTMATVAHWKNGCIAEENLFWDNLTYLQQLGINP